MPFLSCVSEARVAATSVRNDPEWRQQASRCVKGFYFIILLFFPFSSFKWKDFFFFFEKKGIFPFKD